ncbi:MAG: hypothetical protein J6Z82_00395 [Schwartzia sp.]|nr:hypothetical protein [Schwartzia sp. (in: firmicutes)]
MKTKIIVAVCLLLIAAFPGLCLARSDTQFYRNEECVCWADAGTLEQIGGSVYEIWLQAEFVDESIPDTTIVERIDMDRYTYSRQRMFFWDGSRQVDLPDDDKGEWLSIRQDSMDEALYNFIYENLRRRGKL